MGYPYDCVNLRKHPEAYRIGRGEQVIFHAEPYKSELLPLWIFINDVAARESAGATYARFLDFVGMGVEPSAQKQRAAEIFYRGRGVLAPQRGVQAPQRMRSVRGIE